MLNDRVIILDGYGFGGKESGIVNHTINILRHLNKFGIYPYVWLLDYNELFENYKNIYVIKSACKRVITSKIIWPHFIYLKSKNLNLISANTIFHGLSNINIPFLFKSTKGKFVVTIHDIIPIIDKRMVSYSLYLQFNFSIKRLLKKVDKVICISEWTKRTLMEFCKVAEEKIVVIPNGFNKIDDKHVLNYYKESKERLDNKIRLLFVGRFEKYKNINFLLQLLRSYKHKFILHLVSDNIGRLWCINNGSDLISAGILKLYSNLSQDSLKKLYLQTDVYVHPSLYEGFCLPAMEALSYGVPVVYMKGSGIDEVVGHEVGIGLNRKDTIDIWISAIESMFYQSLKQDFCNKLYTYLNYQASWHDIMLKLIKLYDNL